ncbi:exodeoxyribonuclease VII large subunit [Endozoicomonas sp. OPT23]|nr:exodeoxyribonuclease VII large subunit [Endozoicomonas sp. OPT23]
MYDQDLPSFLNQGSQQENQPLTVTELNSQARRLLETRFASIRVEGEISGFVKPASGHWYFTLKDSSAQIRCAMFKGRNRSVKFLPAEGKQVLVRGRVSLYEGRGDYQLIADHVEEAGVGALQRAFEELKRKLAAEGLFNTENKRPLPELPQHIGVITSPTGAAIRDILAVLKRRFPTIPVTVIPSLVQGDAAADELVNALRVANQSQQFDVLIVGRGGGSLEDLWPFNEEKVARAIAASATPVVSAVGHEIDFTITDFVADYRAPTPSAAAEVLSPDRMEWLSKVQFFQRKLNTLIQHKLQISAQALDNSSLRLRNPKDKLSEHSQRLADLDIRLQQAIRMQLQMQQSSLQKSQGSLQQNSPKHRVSQIKSRLEHRKETLATLMQRVLERKASKFQNLCGQLTTVSPLATLSRGYSITRSGGSVITDSEQLNPGDQIETLFKEGKADMQVISVSR